MRAWCVPLCLLPLPNKSWWLAAPLHCLLLTARGNQEQPNTEKGRRHFAHRSNRVNNSVRCRTSGMESDGVRSVIYSGTDGEWEGSGIHRTELDRTRIFSVAPAKPSILAFVRRALSVARRVEHAEDDDTKVIEKIVKKKKKKRPRTPTQTWLRTHPPTSPPLADPTSSPSFGPSSTLSLQPSSDPTSYPPIEPTPSPAFSFYFLGDIPYNEDEFDVLSDQLASLNETNAEFVVHAGDMQGIDGTPCDESSYIAVRDIVLDNSPLPTIVLAGDNDWNDCPNFDEAWAWYEEHFVGIETVGWRDEALALGLERSKDRTENFVMDRHGVLLVGINIVGGKVRDEAEWDARHEQNIRWVETNVGKYVQSGKELRAVIIFGHALIRDNNRDFFDGIFDIFLYGADVYRDGLDVPVLYMHGDGHAWENSGKFARERGWDNFRSIQCEPGIEAPPLWIEVRGDVEGPLERERDDQYVFGDGLIRIDRRGGSYEDFLS